MDYKNDTMSEEIMLSKLYLLSSQANENEKHVLLAIAALIPNLYDCHMKPLSEAHFQVLGTTITFFVMHLKADKLYTFTELTTFEIPKKKDDIVNQPR